MPRTYQHDPEWLLGHMSRDDRAPVGLDGFTTQLGAIYAHDLTDDQRRDIGLRAAGILIGAGTGTADVLRDALEALGVIERGGEE